ncbi:MAG: hypothetical protein ACI31C_05605 [Muribaculaceae bacterium]
MKHLPRHIVIPAALMVYLVIMAVYSYDSWAQGQLSSLQYFGTIGVTLAVIIVLSWSLRRRDRLRRERQQDLENNQ